MVPTKIDRVRWLFSIVPIVFELAPQIEFYGIAELSKGRYGMRSVLVPLVKHIGWSPRSNGVCYSYNWYHSITETPNQARLPNFLPSAKFYYIILSKSVNNEIAMSFGIIVRYRVGIDIVYIHCVYTYSYTLYFESNIIAYTYSRVTWQGVNYG